jgi:molecular chaperone DnaK
MARTKIDYGIDLGTTNSAIARMENGKAVIKKTDTLKDTLPSCISFSKKKVIMVGDRAYTQLESDNRLSLKDHNYKSNTFIEFKRTMGTDKTYNSSNMEVAYSSEDLSAEVLKRLKSFITDEELKSIVITVPAKFTINQNDATSRAARLAGFEHCELLQEPIAASMAYGLDAGSKDGLWLVFDFGGGTFDAAILKVVDGIMKVIDTEGDNYLGGKNIDLALIDEVFIPHFKNNFSVENILSDPDKKETFRIAWKAKAEEAKIQLSFKDNYIVETDLGADYGEDDKGNPLELNLTITQSQMEKVVQPIFQKAINNCNELLKRNNLTGKNLGALILVGGPTFSPILRKMLKEQITEKVDTSIDPMTAVAEGAALFASTINVSEELVEQNRDSTKIQLGLGYEPTTVEMEEFVTIKILKEKTERTIPDKVFAEVVRADKAWASGKVQIDEAGEVIETKLNGGKANSFSILVYNEQGDLLPSEPNEFTIIQGSKIGNAPLPYNIGIEIKSKAANNNIVFLPVRGLEKNETTPATGVANGLKTQKQIKPGMKSDFIKIPIYQGEHGTRGSRAIYNEYVYDVIITGEQLPALLPEGSDVDLTIKVDKSGRISLTAFFPYLNFTEEISVPSNTTQKEISAEWLDIEIAKAKQSLNIIKNEGGAANKEELEKLNSEVAELEKLLEQGRSDYDRKKQVLDNLRRSLRKIDDVQGAAEFPKTEEELKNAFYRLEDTFKKVEGKVEEINDEGVKATIAQFKEQIPQVIKEKNVKVAKELIDQMRELDFILVDLAMGPQMEIQILKEFNDEFDLHEWSDRNKAKMLIQQGLSIAATTPTKQRLRPIVIELYKLLPKSDKPFLGDDDSVLTD